MDYFRMDKIVRHQAAANLTKTGAYPETKRLAQQELIQAFRRKVEEEAKEVSAAESREELAEELGDLLDVIDGFADALQISRQEIDTIRKKKAKERGHFRQVLYITRVGMPINHPKREYLLSQPEKYPKEKS